MRTLPQPILSVINLTKLFGKHLVINNVSFDIYEGEIFGLLGPSDSGKSAILRAIIGSLIPSNGDIQLNGVSYKKDYVNAIKNINGYIKLPKLYKHMTGLNNMKIITSLRGNYNNEILINAAKTTGIDHLINEKVRKYTLADKQKLCIAISIITNPKVIVLDDPFVGLNAKELKSLQDLISLLAKKYNISFILSSQMLGLMEKICDTIAIVNNGSILEIRSMDSLRQESLKEQKLAITVDYPNFAGKVVLTEFNCKVKVCGNKILVFLPESKKDKILERLANYKINVFNVETISKSLDQMMEEVLKRKALNKSWVEEYN